MNGTVRCGIHTPVVILLPGFHGAWEVEATIEDVATVVTVAERLGFDFVSCSEHVVIPRSIAATRGARYFDPLATFGYLSAVTTAIRFATYVLVLGYSHPLQIAKRYGTLDRVSNGRLVLGLGVGSLKEEFDVLGAAFDDRGPRADEAVRALRASLSTSEPTFSGEYYRYDGVIVNPAALQPAVPLWIGGRTGRSLRRAVVLGDGWIPFGLSAQQLGNLISQARQTEAWETRQQPLEVILSNEQPIDPSDDPDGSIAAVEALMVAGATTVQLHLASNSRQHYLEQLEAMAELSVFEPATGGVGSAGRTPA